MTRNCIVLLCIFPLAAQDRVNLADVDRIKAEAFDHSEVMDTLYYLTDVHGPRLTGSPEFEDAARWVQDRLRSYGVSNVHTERWGPFGRSWSLQNSSIEMTKPRYSPISAFPLAWTSSTNGLVTGELMLAPLTMSIPAGPRKWRKQLDDYKAEWAGKIRGKIVLLNNPEKLPDESVSQFHRLTADELADLAKSPDPSQKATAKSLDDLKWPENLQQKDIEKFAQTLPLFMIDQINDYYIQLIHERGTFFAKEGALGVLLNDERGQDGILFAERAGAYQTRDPIAAPIFVVGSEQYNRIARAVDKKLPIGLRFSVQAIVSDQDVDGLNVIGEILGDAKKDEVVMVGAHLDSWHSGTGATDNGAGSAVMIEVMRILKRLNLRLDRSVRLGLWGGEEQGLLGSRAYVKEHFGDPKTMKLTAEHSKLSGYFNLDNGSGKIRGVYLQNYEAMRPLFEAWLAPFQDLGATTISIRNTFGTDHLSFNAVGLPGFQFIQDPLDYDTVTHHSNLDTYDHAVEADLMQAAAIIATCVYEAANRPEMLPRRELPKAR